MNIVFAKDFPHEASPDRLAVGHGALGVGARPGVPADRAEHLAADGATSAVSPVTVCRVLCKYKYIMAKHRLRDCFSKCLGA